MLNYLILPLVMAFTFASMRVHADFERFVDDRDVIGVVADQAEISYDEAELAVVVFLDEMDQALARGDRAVLRDFGAYANVTATGGHCGEYAGRKVSGALKKGDRLSVLEILESTPNGNAVIDTIRRTSDDGDKVLNILKDIRHR